MKYKLRLIQISVAVLLFAGCIKSPYYQREYDIPSNEWQYSYKPSFKFDIEDTTAKYNMYFLIRHTEAYPYNNIWMMIYSKAPNEKTFDTSRIEIPLAESGGKWLGRGIGTSWEQRMPINGREPVRFTKSGTYEMKFEQNMRVNPLPEVLHIGLRVEKITETQ